jgi:hypothetical protein
MTLAEDTPMPKSFIPWPLFFEKLGKQPKQQQWLRRGLFDDRGVVLPTEVRMTREIHPVAAMKQARSVAPLLRIKRDREFFTDLRGSNAGNRT